MNPLNTFHNDIHMRESVKEFMTDCLKEMAVEKSFNGEPVVGIKEAKELVDMMFSKLAELYEPKKAPKIESSR